MIDCGHNTLQCAWWLHPLSTSCQWIFISKKLSHPLKKKQKKNGIHLKHSRSALSKMVAGLIPRPARLDVLPVPRHSSGSPKSSNCVDWQQNCLEFGWLFGSNSENSFFFFRAHLKDQEYYRDLQLHPSQPLHILKLTLRLKIRVRQWLAYELHYKSSKVQLRLNSFTWQLIGLLFHFTTKRLSDSLSISML